MWTDRDDPRFQPIPEALTVTMAMNRHPIDHALQVLLTTLLLVGGAVGLAAGVLVTIGVRRGLAPLEHLKGQLATITGATMAERLRGGTTLGYLAYVDGRPAGWVNASLRSEYGLYRLVDPDGPEPRSVIGVSCFVIAPPFRRHGIASALLDRVMAVDPPKPVAACPEKWND
jgi:GNAT superfamily N-acetyltransferase